METKAKSLSSLVIEISIALIVLAILVGTVSLRIFFGVNSTGWGATNILIWGVFPTVALAVIVMGLVSYMRHHGSAE